MVHSVRLIGDENIHRTRGGGGRGRFACQKCHFVIRKIIEMRERKDPSCKWKQNACLDVTGGNLEWGGKRWAGKGKSWWVRGGCHQCEEGSEETFPTVSDLHCWSWWWSSATDGLRTRTEWSLESAQKSRCEDPQQPSSRSWSISSIITNWALCFLLQWWAFPGSISCCFSQPAVVESIQKYFPGLALFLMVVTEALFSLKLSWRCLILSSQHLSAVTVITWWSPC